MTQIGWMHGDHNDTVWLAYSMPNESKARISMLRLRLLLCVDGGALALCGPLGRQQRVARDRGGLVLPARAPTAGGGGSDRNRNGIEAIEPETFAQTRRKVQAACQAWAWAPTIEATQINIPICSRHARAPNTHVKTEEHALHIPEVYIHLQLPTPDFRISSQRKTTWNRTGR